MIRYLIIGNGVAGTTAADHVRRHDETGEITVVSNEDLPFYYRIRLPDFLGGGVGEAELVAKIKAWYDEKRISLKLNCAVTGADPEKGLVYTADKGALDYDRLILANGSHPFIPPVRGADKNNVFALHTIDDARQILQAAETAENVVFIGGGLLGLEAANGLHRPGRQITVVEFFPRLLPRQLDREGADRLQRFFENRGFTFKLGTTTSEITGGKKAEAVVLADGEILPAGMVIISAGIRPNLELAQMLGVKTDRGVLVNSFMQTSRAEIYAAGDVIQFGKRIYGIWPAAMEQGRIAGKNSAGAREEYTGTTLSNILKVAGIDLASAGEIDAENRYESRTVATKDVYKKIVIDGSRVIGCIMLGDRKNFSRINRAIDDATDITGELDSLLSG
jgi:nitrite reductase (NADH) large subunit